MEFKPYTKENAKTILSFIKDEESFYKWSAGVLGNYPLTTIQFDQNMQERIQSNQAFPYVVYEDHKLIGFILLRYPNNSKEEMRLGFIILDPVLRGIGLGKRMVKEAIEYCFQTYLVSRVSLGVFENNLAALNCYLGAGMKLKDEVEMYEFLDYKWKCLELYIERI